MNSGAWGNVNNFLQVASGVDVMPLLAAIYRQPELWDRNTLRTKHPGTAHKNVSDIWLFFNHVEDDGQSVINDIQTMPYPAWDLLPQVRPIIFDLMRRVEATQLGRVLLTKLAPGKEITPHTDQGAPATFYTRFQIAVQSKPGCNFYIEDEVVNMKSGDVWMINNNAEHSVKNNSNADRIALVVDLRCE